MVDLPPLCLFAMAAADSNDVDFLETDLAVDANEAEVLVDEVEASDLADFTDNAVEDFVPTALEEAEDFSVAAPRLAAEPVLLTDDAVCLADTDDGSA